MLEIEVFHLFMVIITVSIVTCSFIFLFNQIIKSINLLDTKSKNSELIGFITNIDSNFIMTFHHAPFLGLRYLTGNSKGIKIQFYGLKQPIFKNTSLNLQNRILEKMRLDILTQDITIKIKKQNKDFKLLCICETNTLIKRDLGYEYIFNGFFSLDYNIEQEEAHLFRDYKEAESQARERKCGLWKYELMDEEEEELDIPFMQTVNEIDELDF